MEVTKENFNTSLPQIQEAIKNCTFLSIDCELTGLKTQLNHINAYDTPKQYYEKLKRDCKEFLVIQYGLSFFRYTENMFKQQTYNFYIFRKPINKSYPDKRFLCQTSSIDFLTKQGFDFNKLFQQGISYLNIPEESKCREYLAEQQQRRLENLKSNESNIIAVPDDKKEFVKKIIQTLEDFIKSEEPEVQLPRCNAFMRKLIYQTKTERFDDKISLETRQVNQDRILVATRLKSKDELEDSEKKHYDNVVNELEDYVGFTKVIRMIVESGKLVIGHNIMLDFLHTIEKFLTPLPDEYDEFKSCANSLFSTVLDTKYMSSSEPFKDVINSTVLKHLFESVSQEPFEIPKIEIEENCEGYCMDSNKEHEAGFDSYITAISFIAMWQFLGRSRKLTEEETFGNFDLLEPYMNRIFLMILTDNQYINLSGEDLTPSRDHVFHLTFPKTWKTNNIVQLFSPFGNVSVSWLDETSAYVGLYKKDQAAIALATLSQSDTYTVTTFAKRQALLSGIHTPLASPIVSKKRRSFDSAPPVTKRRRTDSFERTGPKRSIDPIEEEPLLDDKVEEVNKRSKRKLRSPQNVKKGSKSKTFNEDESWE